MDKLYKFPEETEKFLRASYVPLAVYQYIDGKVRTVLVTDGLCRALGVTSEQLKDKFDNDMYSNVLPEDVKAVVEASRKFAENGGSYDVIYREKLRNENEHRLIHAVGFTKITSDGTRLLYIRYEDITQAAIDSNAHWRDYIRSVEELYDRDSKAMAVAAVSNLEIIYANKAFCKIMKPVKALDMGITFSEYFYDEPVDVAEVFRSGVGKGSVFLKKNGSDDSVSAVVRADEWNGRDVYIIEISEKNEAYFDILTGLPNHYYFEMFASEAIRKIDNSGDTAVCIFFDISGMKHFNSQFGFEEGDRLLKETAGILRKEYPGRLVSRPDNDHFLVICEDMTAESGKAPPSEHILRRIRRIRRLVTAIVPDAHIELKAGIYAVRSAGESPAAVGDCAKLACDSIRNDAEHFTAVFSDKLRENVENRKYITEHIDEAIEKRYIKVFYQPVIRTFSKKLCGMEALARWQSPVLGFLSPAAFIPALEESHQIHKLDTYVIREICRNYREITDKGMKAIPVSFNLSRLDFIMCDIFDIVENAVEEFDVPRDMIHVEITESMIMFNSDKIHFEMSRFHKAGYQIWMDDFGSGYSSINVLKDYDFDEIKLDMKFLSSFSDKTKSIITSCIEMAKNIGIQTLAEGVETKEQFDFLRSIGCEKVQGYYFGKPDYYENSIRKCMESGLSAETKEQREYYDIIGRTSFVSDKPTALVEFADGRYEVCYVNKSCRDMFAAFGSDIAESITSKINDRVSLTGSMFRSAAAKLSRLGECGEFVINIDNSYIKIDISMLSVCGDNIMYVVYPYNVTNKVEDDVKVRLLDKVLRSIYLSCEEIYAHYVNGDYTVQLHGDPYFIEPGGRRYGLAEIMREYSEKFIHPDYRKPYIGFKDQDEILRKMKNTDSGYISRVVKALDSDNEYHDMLVTSFLFSDNKEDILITFIRKLDKLG